MKRRMLPILVACFGSALSAQSVLSTLTGAIGPSNVRSFGSWNGNLPLSNDPIARDPSIAALGDVDGDGTADFAIADATYHATTVAGFPSTTFAPNGRIWVYSGATFQPIAVFDPPAGSFGYGTRIGSVGDLDGDGAAELVDLSMTGTPTVFTGTRTLRRVADGAPLATFARTYAGSGPFLTLAATFVGPAVWRAGDWNGDAIGDIAKYECADSLVAPTVKTTVETYEHIGLSGLTPAALYASSWTQTTSCPPPFGCLLTTTAWYRSTGMRLGDVDGDGRDDQLIASRLPVQAVEVLLSSTGQSVVHPIYWAGLTPLADVDGDDVRDYAVLRVPTPPTAYVDVYSGATRSIVWTLSYPTTEFIAGPWQVLSDVGDVDRDGCGDFLASYITSQHLLRVYSGRTGQAIVTLAPPSGGYFGYPEVLGDLNGDGIAEVLVPYLNGESVDVVSLKPSNFHYFGSGGPSFAGKSPQIGLRGKAAGGGHLEFMLANVPPTGLGVLVLGFSDLFWNSLPLPYGLGAIGLAGENLYVSADILDFAFVTPNGSRGIAGYTYAFPYVTLTGITLFAQWFAEDLAGSPASFRVSDAARIDFN